MSRKRTGSVEYRSGQWWGQITCNDGSRPRIPLGDFPNSPQGRERAKESAAHWTEQAREQGVVAVRRPRRAKGAPPQGPAPGESVAKYVERWLEDRERRGLSTVDTDRGRLELHVLPLFEGKAIATATKDDVRAVVERLDDAVRAKSIAWSTATKVWGLVTKMFSDACESKVAALRVRAENPAKDVRGPDRGARKGKQWLYPSEVTALLARGDVPLRWRRLYALAAYLYVRPGELAALEWGDVDLERGIVNVHRAIELRGGEEKATKTGTSRKLPIPLSLRPLLALLHEEHGGIGRVLRHEHRRRQAGHGMPPLEDLAATLRAHLWRAGVRRSELHEDRETSKRVTFYDLRATGITWEVLDGTEHVRVMQRAGHRNFSTTQLYVREAEAVGIDVGTPFPPLPASLLEVNRTAESHKVPAEFSKLSESLGKRCVPNGIRTRVTALKGPCPGPARRWGPDEGAEHSPTRQV